MTGRSLTLVQAANEAFREEMERDSRVILLGEDVRTGVYGFTADLHPRFGDEPEIDMPISEAGFTGLAIGAALAGLRPIVDYMIASFMYLALDQIVNNAAKLRYMSGGTAAVPFVGWALAGARGSTGAQHADAMYGLFMGIPGLRVAVPSNPADCRGLLKTAIRSDDPVMFLQPTGLGRQRAEVPEGDYLVPFGKARIVRPGSDVTVVAIGALVPKSVRVAEALSGEGIEVEVIDPRTLSPLDADAIAQSFAKTTRLVVVDEDTGPAGPAASIVAAIVASGAAVRPGSIAQVTRVFAPVPYAPDLEKAIVPSESAIRAAIEQVVRET